MGHFGANLGKMDPIGANLRKLGHFGANLGKMDHIGAYVGKIGHFGANLAFYELTKHIMPFLA